MSQTENRPEVSAYNLAPASANINSIWYREIGLSIFTKKSSAYAE